MIKQQNGVLFHFPIDLKNLENQKSSILVFCNARKHCVNGCRDNYTCVLLQIHQDSKRHSSNFLSVQSVFWLHDVGRQFHIHKALGT